jgi:hypothetical protein
MGLQPSLNNISEVLNLRVPMMLPRASPES